MKTKNQEKSKKIRVAALSQVFSMILEIFAFSFIVGGMTFGVSVAVAVSTPSVSATGINDVILKGCCLEMKDGGICQTINQLDADMCKTGLISSDCSTVDNCMTGCCYNQNEGSCSFNSPKQKCEQNGGNWSDNKMCNIQQCQLGCCILGDQATPTTTRECTKLSQGLNFEKKFLALDADGTCNSKTGLSTKGACVKPASDFSGENDCKFGTKEDCIKSNGNFYEDYLCTAKSLKTNCAPSKDTTCVKDKDQIYYLDSCGNTANIYDATKFGVQDYWEKIIAASDSCSAASADCGNCDYITGSVCSAYRKGKDTKATYGNNVCRNLNCANGRKHGESWCISDYQNTESAGVAPVGSRWFRGVCMDGEISIEPCADFNQEVCIQSTDTSAGFTEAQCTVNDWRSCMAANNLENYDAIKTECARYPQCAMFYDAEGQTTVDLGALSSDIQTAALEGNADALRGQKQDVQNLLTGDSGYSLLPGFRVGIENAKQGAAGDVGKDNNNNKVIQWCVPKYTPGMVFWQDTNTASITGKTTATTTTTQTGATTSDINSVDYGGSYAETQGICSLADFTCVSHQKRNCELGGQNILTQSLCTTGYGTWNPGSAKCDAWGDKENWQCNADGAHQTIKGKDLPKLMEAMNERCRMLGPCGSYVNVVGELGGSDGFTVTRGKIDEKGKSKDSLSTTDYKLSADSLSNLKEKASLIKSGTLTSLTAAIISNLITGKAAETTAEQAQNKIANSEQTTDQALQTVSSVGSLASMGALSLGSSISSTATQTALNLQGPIFTDIGQIGGVATSGTSSLGTGFTDLGYTLVAAVAAYFVASAIAKNQNWSPGKSTTWIKSFTANIANLAAGAILILTHYGIIGGTICTTTGVETLGLGCIVAIVVVIVGWIYTNCIDNKYNENQYYTVQFTCEPWSPPNQGDCNACNNDIRTCSENRCRSLGLNCQYYNTNGEPGWCAAIDDTWSAKITPWPEALTTGNKYTDVTLQHFTIQGNFSNDGKVEPWVPLEFGIITDKPATCKIDNKHTKTFDEMAVEMIREAPANSPQEAQGNIQGTYHKIALSSNIGQNSSAQGTLPLVTGQENNYYIRCKNFAGLGNDAEFAVKINTASGPDLTPPYIKSFSPISGSYLSLGTNSTQMTLQVDEPAECRYSIGVNNNFNDMNNNMSCAIGENMAVLGKWPCYTTLNNLTVGENKYYFKCKDKPLSLERTVAEKRIVNENAQEYTLNVCSKGLQITSVSPNGKIISGKSPVGATLNVETSGCIDGGVSTCYYRFGNSQDIQFADTNSKQHKQVFTDLAAGNYNMTITCQDEAGNTASSSAFMQVELDNTPPRVLRFFQAADNLVVVTNEDSACRYTSNSTLGCSFDFDTDNADNMTGTGTYHSAPWLTNKDYYVKCEDAFGNSNLIGCGAQLKTY